MCAGRRMARIALMKRVALVGAYALLWILNRWPAIRANTLFFDDFDAPRIPAAYYIGPYRPVLWLEYHFWNALIPNFLWSYGPKILGAVYTGLAAMALAMLLRQWGVRAWLAASVPLIVIVNPVLADGALWNTVHALPLGVYFAAEAIRVRRWSACLALSLLAVCTYQVMIAVAAILAVAEPVVRRRFDARQTGKRLAAIAVAAGLQIVMMILLRRFYEGADARGLALAPTIGTFVMAKWHGATNLIANGWMPVIAWYLGAIPAMSLWKWIPIVIAVANAIAVRTARLATALATLVILALPAAPILVASANPYAWRVSIPVAVALAVALVPLLAALPQRVAAALIVVLVALMAPVSWYESSERVAAFQRERAFVESIGRHWNGQPFTTGFGSPIDEDRSNGGRRDLTWGFQIRTPGMWTVFAAEGFARPYLVSYLGLQWTSDQECICGPVTHHEVRRTSVICGQSPPCRDMPENP